MVAVVLIILVAVLVSLYGFRNSVFFERFAFSVGGILRDKQYERFIISIFLHVDWIHLFFNLFSFYSFAIEMVNFTGQLFLLLLFFGSGLGGDLLALLIHRKHPGYRAVGASGAISGVIFSSVLLLPGGSILIFPLPFGIPPWLFAILFVLFSVYGIGRQSGNIGHEAHLGGALCGIFITALIYPQALFDHWFLTMVLMLPVTIFLYLFLKNPEMVQRGRWGE